MKTKFSILLSILLFASFLRLWKLGTVPPSASLDEVSIGWNAYSILSTGKDEYGTKFPMLLRAYDDWRPALYVYLVVPFIKLFGLTVVAVRLPSVMLSILTVLATYFLVMALFSRQDVALLTSLLLAISPWHVYISRLGHEANAGLAFLVFGMLLFLKKRIFLSAISMALSFISYQSEKIIVPVIVLTLLVLFYKELLKAKRQAIIGIVIALMVLIPFSLASVKPEAFIRFKGTSVLKEAPTIRGKTTIVVKQYLSHFKPEWLFKNSGRDAHKVPNLGVLYLWEAPLILIGLYVLIKSKVGREIKALVFIWFFSSPLAASVTTQAPHVMRSYTFLPLWQIFGGLGGIYLLDKFIRYKNLLAFAFLSIVALTLVNFYHNYFIVFPRTQSDSFQYALHQAVGYVLENESKYSKIVFSNEHNLYQSYMFFLFTGKYDPELYQEQGGTVSGGFAETHRFGKYEFRRINWIAEEKDKNILYIGNPDEISEKGIKQFNYLDGSVAIIIKHG